MAKPHKFLRDALGDRDMTETDLAEALGVNRSTISRKLMGKAAWTSDQMWRIMDMLHIPAKQFYLVFPNCGKPA